jgi:hypothetical protein
LTEIIAEQFLAVHQSDGSWLRVKISIDRPRPVVHPTNGVSCWACYPKVDGLIDLVKPVYGSSTFVATVQALQICRQVLRDYCKGAKFYLVKSEDSSVDKEMEVSLKILFAMA